MGDAVNARLIPGGDAPIPEQIEYLRREVDSLHAAVEAARQAAAQAEARLTGRVDGVEARGIETTRELDDRLTAVATGSVRLELVGLVLVGIGSVLSVG